MTLDEALLEVMDAIRIYVGERAEARKIWSEYDEHVIEALIHIRDAAKSVAFSEFFAPFGDNMPVASPCIVCGMVVPWIGVLSSSARCPQHLQEYHELQFLKKLIGDLKDPENTLGEIGRKVCDLYKERIHEQRTRTN